MADAKKEQKFQNPRQVVPPPTSDNPDERFDERQPAVKQKQKSTRPDKRTREKNKKADSDKKTEEQFRGKTQTAPKDEDLWDVPGFQSSIPISSGYSHNLDFSGYPAVVQSSYSHMRKLNPRIEKSLPYCVYQHSCISRLNAYLIRYVQTENNENRFADEGSPFDIFGSDETALQFHPSVHEYLAGIGKTSTRDNETVRINIPLDALPKDQIVHMERVGAEDRRIIISPGSFGPITSTTHNLYECYASPLVSKRLVEVSKANRDPSEWAPLPESTYPINGVFTHNCIGYRRSERIAPDFRNQMEEITFASGNNMAGRLCYSMQIEQVVNQFLSSLKSLLKLRQGFPPFTYNTCLTCFVEYTGQLPNTHRVGDHVNKVNSHVAQPPPINCRSTILSLKRRRHPNSAGLCVTSEATDESFTMSRNDNFTMTGIFSPVSTNTQRDMAILRSERWYTINPQDSRLDILMSWNERFNVK